MVALVDAVIGLMGVLAALSLVQTGLLFRISRALGNVKARMEDAERRLRKIEER